jgi:ribosomal subunit interface protein
MQINIKATEIDLTPALKVYIEKKLGPLSKFIKKFDEEGQVELWVEVARTTRHHHKGFVFMAEGRLPLPKKALYVAEYHDDARKAIDAMKRVLKQEIDKYKTKHDAVKPARVRTNK